MPIGGTLGAVAIAAACVGSLAVRASAVVVVVGTGDPTVDVPAVQAAVDQGGAVVLSGTFDFGTHSGNHIIVPGRAGLDQDVRGQSTVFIYKADVRLMGEIDEGGNLLTTVRNGMPPFWIGWDGNVSRTQPPGAPNEDFGIETLPQDSQGRVEYRDTGPEPGYAGPQTRYAVAYPNVSATIRDIVFESPRHYGIKATAGRNIAFVGNVFRDVRWGGLVHLNGFAAVTHIALACAGFAGFYAPFLHPSVTGSLLIQGNRVEDVGTEVVDTHEGECYGLAARTGAAVTIAGNYIRDVGRKRDGTRPKAFAGSILVADNLGGAPYVGENAINNSANIGILDLSAFAASPPGLIVGNTIENCPIGILAEGWRGVPKSGVVIRSNRISQDGSLGAGTACIRQANADAFTLSSNTFSGAFEQAVHLESCRNDRILWNDAAALTTPAGHPTYLLSGTSCGNIIRAHAGTAVSETACDNDIVLDAAPSDAEKP